MLMPALTVALLASLVLGLTSCDDDDGEGRESLTDSDDRAVENSARSSGPETERSVEDKPALLARVSAAIRGARGGYTGAFDAIAYTNFDAIRSQLGLPPDAGFGEQGRRRQLFSFASRPLFLLGTLFEPRPGIGALGKVLDSSQLEGAAGTDFAFSGPGSGDIIPDDVLVVRTGQPFEEIAANLREQGYEESSADLLTSRDRLSPGKIRVAWAHDGVPFPAVGEAGGGVVVFGGSVRATRTAVMGADVRLTPAAKLLVQLPGASRLARGRFGAPCVSVIGLGEDAAPRRGVLVVKVDGGAEAERLLFGGMTFATGFPGPEREIEFGTAKARGTRASVRFSSTDRLNPTRLPAENVEFPYSCSS